jgi:4-amino-4-deoxy-L-arabinose transferase-like glycosyltransferase
MTAPAIERDALPTVDDADPPRSRWQRIVRGPATDPAWVRPSLVALLLGTALLYIWGLSASGYANTFYSAAVQAGTKSWKAMFFGSFDSSSFITVDKPPASLWVMEISARIFGLSSWSVLVPQALEGVAAVGMLYATVRRRFSPQAGLIAGLVLATTPVATLMFRFNNPDALLVLLLVGAAYAVTRALESTRTRWLVLAGALVGFGFITKMLQAALVVPGFGLVYLVYAQTTLRRRVMQLVAALGSIVVAAGWWVAAVMLTPASARPYVGGSTNDSILQLAFGYNGLGRLTGNETGSVGGAGGAGGSGMWGKTGLLRMFNADMGGQISWLIPAALLLAIATMWGLRRAGRGNGQRAQVLLWASWLIVTGVTFSLSKGIIHPYYTVALAPAVGALIGIGSVVVWGAREQWWSRVVMSATLVVTTWWSYHLLQRSPSWHPALRAAILVAGLVVAAMMLIPTSWFAAGQRHVGRAVAAGALVVALAGPVAYSLDTASSAYAGALPSAGPAVTGAVSGPGGRGGFGGPAGRGGFGPAGGLAGGLGLAGGPQGPTGGTSTGGFSGGTRAGTGGGFSTGTTGGLGGGLAGRAGGGIGGAGGGLLNAGTVSSVLKAALQANASSYTWVVATVGAETASGYQLASDEPVMAIGGFNGTDQAPSLAAFEKYVSEGKIHYFITGGGGAGPGGGQGVQGVQGAGGQSAASDDAGQITAWVEAHYTAKTIGGTKVYDLSSSTTSGSTGSA